MYISTMLDKAIKLWPTREAVVCGNLRLTYADFARRAHNLAQVLLYLDLKPGDRVAILHNNCHVFLEAYYAAAYAGLILTPINHRLSTKELRFILEDSGARVLISQPEMKDKISEVIAFNKDKKIYYSG